MSASKSDLISTLINVAGVIAIHDMVAEVNAQNDWAIPLHVDAVRHILASP
jgi:hypothetical protein